MKRLKLTFLILLVTIMSILLSNNPVFAKYKLNKNLNIGSIEIKKGVFAKLYDTDNDGIGETLVLDNTSDFTYKGTLITNYNKENNNDYQKTTESIPIWSNELNTIKNVVIQSPIQPTCMANWFNGARNLTEIEGFEYIDGSNNTSLCRFLTGTKALTQLDVSTLDTSKVTDMRSCFHTTAIKNVDLSSWNTSNVTEMTTMFTGCRSETVNVTGFDLGKVSNLYGLFANSCNLKQIIGLNTWITSNITEMGDMFGYIDGSTSSNQLEELDLSSWDTSNITNMGGIFYQCKNLKTIYVSQKFVTNNLIKDGLMFTNCYSLVGGNGTNHTSAKTNKEYARIDKGAIEPGYFTYRDSEYTAIPYLSNYNDDIYTGIYPNENIKFQTKMSTSQTTGSIVVGPGDINHEKEAFRLFNYNNKFYLDYGTGEDFDRIIGGTWNNYQTYELEVGNRYVKDLMANTNIVSASKVNPFEYNEEINICMEVIDKLYYFRIYDNDILVRDFIPVKDSNGTEGLLDLVEHKFYSSTLTRKSILKQIEEQSVNNTLSNQNSKLENLDSKTENNTIPDENSLNNENNSIRIENTTMDTSINTEELEKGEIKNEIDEKE